MKVVICGAGEVGTSIAMHLAGEDIDVTLVDQDPSLVKKLSEALDVRTIVGHASHPHVLMQAGIEDADMVIAVTLTDEVNIVACHVAESLFNVTTRIARIRHPEYRKKEWFRAFIGDKKPISVSISPEEEVAHAMGLRLQVPGAFDVAEMCGGLVRVVGVHCDEDCPIINTPIRQLTELFPDLCMVILGIIRDDKGLVPKSSDEMRAGDDVYFVCDVQHLGRAMAAFGHEETEGRSVIIAGGGNVGLLLAAEIEKCHQGVRAKVIELNRDRAKYVAQTLDHTIVLNGDALDPEILEEANITDTETFIAVSNDDEVNIISSLLAKRAGAKRAMVLITTHSYAQLVTPLGIDAVVNPRVITVSSILQHVRRGMVRGIYAVRQDFGEVMEVVAVETSSIVRKSLRDIRMPNGVIIGAILRDGKVINPRGATVINARDRVVLFTTYKAVKSVEELFAVGIDYF